MKSRAYILPLTAFLLLGYALFGWNHVLELRAEEPRRAIVALEMYLTGNFWVPRIHDWSYYNKPPMFNWLVLAFYHVTGQASEWVVRLPSLLSLFAAAFLICKVTWKMEGKQTGLLAAFFFITSADILFYGSVNAGEIDLFFSFLVCAQVLAIYSFQQQGRYLAMFGISYLLAAMGTLTKGPPSIAFQVLTLVPWLLVNRQWRLLFSWQHATGIVLYILVAGGYFLVYDRFDDAAGFMVRLFKEASQRTGMEHGIADTVLASVMFPLYLVQWLAPWSLLAIFFFRKGMVRELWQRPLLRFAIVFILFNIPLYWFTADHKVRYLYMFFPFICVLLAWSFLQWPVSLHSRKHVVMKVLGGAMVLGTGAFMALPFIPALSGVPGLTARSILLALGGALLCYAFFMRGRQVMVVVVFMVVLRLGYNLFYLPAAAEHSTSMIYRAHIQQVLDLTGGEQVRWTGTPYVFESDASLGPVTISNVRLTSAPLVAYQVPYYLALGNGHVMRFDTVPLPGLYYLAHEASSATGPVLYSFPDEWVDRELVLFRAR